MPMLQFCLLSDAGMVHSLQSMGVGSRPGTNYFDLPAAQSPSPLIDYNGAGAGGLSDVDLEAGAECRGYLADC